MNNRFNIIIDEEIKTNLDEKFEKNITDELVLFFSTYEPQIFIDLYITNDLYTKRKSLVCGLNDFKLVGQNKVNIKNFSGCMALGKTTHDNFSALLSYKAFEELNNSDSWRGTIHHECTHACDYYNYLKFNNILESDNIYETEYYREFWLWSEFHARLYGSYRNYKYLKYSLQSTEYQIDPKLTIDNLVNDYVQNDSDYNLMQILGILANLAYFYGRRPLDYFRNKLSENNIPNAQICAIYNFLVNCINFDEVKFKFENFRNILNS